jgi:DNA-directed RNA polymerase specialized sigma24 family protein
MAESKPLIAAIRGGEETKQGAMREMYTDSEYRKIAWRYYQRCSAGRRLLEWEDFLAEAILRFVEGVARGSEVRSAQAFFYGICRNYCTELTRKLREPEDAPPEEPPLDELIAKVETYLGRMRKQCRILLHMIHFHDPPYDPRDREKIVAELHRHGFSLKESSVSATITNCRAELRRLIGNELDDYLSQ